MFKHKKQLTFLATISAISLGSMHALNCIISSSSLLKNILKPQAGRRYSWKMGELYYQKKGHGTPLLLIHDLNPFSSGYEWNKIENELAKNHTVYTIDLLGCGRSEKPGMIYTNYLYVQLISDFIRDVIGEKTDVVVTGLSSSFVIMTAHQDDSLIDRIVMINPTSLKKLDQTPTERSKILISMMCIPIISTSIYHIRTCKQNVEYLMTEKYFYNPFLVEQKCVDSYYEAAHRKMGGGKYLLASLDGFYLNTDIRKALGTIRNDITILYGEKLGNEKEIAESYQKINPTISVAPIFETKLLPHLETPQEVLFLLNVQ